MIHRHQTLTSKILPASFATVLDQTIKIMNFIKGETLNSRLFIQLCTEIDANHYILLFNKNV